MSDTNNSKENVNVDSETKIVNDFSELLSLITEENIKMYNKYSIQRKNLTSIVIKDSKSDEQKLNYLRNSILKFNSDLETNEIKSKNFDEFFTDKTYLSIENKRRIAKILEVIIDKHNNRMEKIISRFEKIADVIREKKISDERKIQEIRDILL